MHWFAKFIFLSALFSHKSTNMYSDSAPAQANYFTWTYSQLNISRVSAGTLKMHYCPKSKTAIDAMHILCTDAHWLNIFIHSRNNLIKLQHTR